MRQMSLRSIAMRRPSRLLGNRYRAPHAMRMRGELQQGEPIMNATSIALFAAAWLGLVCPAAGTGVRRRPSAKPATGVA